MGQVLIIIRIMCIIICTDIFAFPRKHSFNFMICQTFSVCMEVLTVSATQIQNYPRTSTPGMCSRPPFPTNSSQSRGTKHKSMGVRLHFPILHPWELGLTTCWSFSRLPFIANRFIWKVQFPEWILSVPDHHQVSVLIPSSEHNCSCGVCKDPGISRLVLFDTAATSPGISASRDDIVL